jgi:pyruvate formate lyase activating enzyme
MSFGSVGCNFFCPGCQNWDISFAEAADHEKETIYISPEDSIRLAFQNEAQGLSWTYNEPTLWFEYTLDGALLAKQKGLYTNYVTNGFITAEALDLIGPHLDSYRVDIKGFSKRLYKELAHVNDFQGILDVTERAKKKWEMHVEIVTNIIPTFNDDMGEIRDIARWIVGTLGKETPWHITKFYPHHKLRHLKPTPIKTLEQAYEVGLQEGLNYVYLGNLPGHKGENTYCHSCKALLIERDGFSITQNKIKGHNCPNCGTKIPGVF